MPRKVVDVCTVQQQHNKPEPNLNHPDDGGCNFLRNVCTAQSNSRSCAKRWASRLLSYCPPSERYTTAVTICTTCCTVRCHNTQLLQQQLIVEDVFSVTYELIIILYTTASSFQAVLWNSRLVAGRPLRRPGFDPTSVQVALAQDCLRSVLRFPLSLPIHQCSMFIFHSSTADVI